MMLRLLRHYRVYECAQALVPAVAGVIMGLVASRTIRMQTGGYLIGCFAHQLFVYAFNDWCDFELDSTSAYRDVRDRNRTLHRRSVWVFLAVSLLALLLMDLHVALVLLTIQVLASAYSAPWPHLKTVPPMSEVIHYAAGTGYFLCGVMSTASPLDASAWLAASFFGLTYASGGLNNAVVDHDNDRQHGARTLAVRWGRRRSLQAVAALQILGIVCLGLAGAERWKWVVPVLGGIAYVILIRNGFPAAESQSAQLRFRRLYRLLFGLLTVVTILSWVVLP